MGQDATYPTYDTVPKGLAFSCQSRPPGYYADPEAQCQVNNFYITNDIIYKEEVTISVGASQQIR